MFFSIYNNISINSTVFPDDTFRHYILDRIDIDINNDNILSPAEISNLTYIDVSEKSISSLKGVEYFTELTSLYCRSNNLKNLDVSKNIKLLDLLCDENHLTSLDLSNNTSLICLYCDYNDITSLNISNCTSLETIHCPFNKLSSLDVSKCIKADFICVTGNTLTSLDISNNTLLTILECANNNLESLNLSNNNKLGNLECTRNKITSLDIRNTLLSTSTENMAFIGFQSNDIINTVTMTAAQSTIYNDNFANYTDN